MRRVKLCVGTSLDGYIAGPNEEVDWLFTDRDYGMSELYSSIDTVLLGRKTYDFMRRHGHASYKPFHNYVFSRSAHTSEHPDVEWVKDDPAVFVDTLRKGQGKDIWLVGGGELFAYLLDQGQIDDIVLGLHPIILGSGITLYAAVSRSVQLELTRTEPYDTGLVILYYQVRREDA